MGTIESARTGEHAAWLSIGAYLVLSIIKLLVGYTAGSEALIADGLNNTTDIISSVAVLVGLRIARKPPDHNHKYGHVRAETIAALLAAFIMMAVGLQVLAHAATTAFTGATGVPDPAAAWTALGSAAIMFAVAAYNFRLSKESGSLALTAVAQDNRSDAFVSLGAFAGIAGAQFGLPWLDPAAALLVGILICKTAWSIFRNASHTLSDGFDEQQLNAYIETISAVPGVMTVREIRARMNGSRALVDVTILVHGHLNVVESHDISEHVETKMRRVHRIAGIHIHVEPLQATASAQES